MNPTQANVVDPGPEKAMHPSMVRLYEFAYRTRQVRGVVAVARLLGEAKQAVKHWETRGISPAGALKAKAALGCNPGWLVYGEGPMTGNDNHNTQDLAPTALTDSEMELVRNYRRLLESQQMQIRQSVMNAMQEAIRLTQEVMAKHGRESPSWIVPKRNKPDN